MTQSEFLADLTDIAGQFTRCEITAGYAALQIQNLSSYYIDSFVPDNVAKTIKMIGQQSR